MHVIPPLSHSRRLPDAMVKTWLSPGPRARCSGWALTPRPRVCLLPSTVSASDIPKTRPAAKLEAGEAAEGQGGKGHLFFHTDHGPRELLRWSHSARLGPQGPPRMTHTDSPPWSPSGLRKRPQSTWGETPARTAHGHCCQEAAGPTPGRVAGVSLFSTCLASVTQEGLKINNQNAAFPHGVCLRPEQERAGEARVRLFAPLALPDRRVRARVVGPPSGRTAGHPPPGASAASCRSAVWPLRARGPGSPRVPPWALPGRCWRLARAVAIPWADVRDGSLPGLLAGARWGCRPERLHVVSSCGLDFS